MKRRIISIGLAVMLVGACLSGPAFGQEYPASGVIYPTDQSNLSETPAQPVLDTAPSSVRKLPVITVNGGWVGEADVNDDEGNFSFDYIQAALSYSYFTLSYTQHRYYWDDVHLLSFGDGVSDPWETLHRFSLSGRYNGRISDRWGYFARAGLSVGYEGSPDRPEFSLAGGGVYTLSPTLRLQLGAMVMNHRIRTLIYPILGLNFTGSGRSESGWSGALGFPETQLTYRFDSHFGIKLAGFVDSRIYKLRDGSPVQDNGYLETIDYAGGLFFLYSPIPNLDIDAGGGYIFKREFMTYNSDGHKRGDNDVGLAPLVRFGLKYQF